MRIGFEMIWRPAVAVMFCLFAGAASAAATPQAVNEQACGVDSHKPAKRVFAKMDDKQAWREYKRLKEVPELSLDLGESAESWTGNNGRLLIRTVEPGEDFWVYTEYCFAANGHLAHVALEVRTAWGWAFQTWGSVSNGAIRADPRVFISTETGKVIPKPEGADDIRETLKPALYLEVTQLPFYSLLRR